MSKRDQHKPLRDLGKSLLTNDERRRGLPWYQGEKWAIARARRARAVERRHIEIARRKQLSPAALAKDKVKRMKSAAAERAKQKEIQEEKRKWRAEKYA